MDSKPAATAAKTKTAEEISVDRGFELYVDRGTLNMRRGLSITIDGIDDGGIPVNLIGERECELLRTVLASKCVVLAALDGTNRTASRRIRLSLAFQESTKPAGWSRPNRDHFRLIRQPISMTTTVERDQTAARAAVYRQIGAFCGLVPAGSDNCSLLAGEVALEFRQGSLKTTGLALLGVIDERMARQK